MAMRGGRGYNNRNASIVDVMRDLACPHKVKIENER